MKFIIPAVCIRYSSMITYKCCRIPLITICYLVLSGNVVAWIYVHICMYISCVETGCRLEIRCLGETICICQRFLKWAQWSIYQIFRGDMNLSKLYWEYVMRLLYNWEYVNYPSPLIVTVMIDGDFLQF